jgi:hypothetical protein
MRSCLQPDSLPCGSCLACLYLSIGLVGLDVTGGRHRHHPNRRLHNGMTLYGPPPPTSTDLSARTWLSTLKTIV